MDEKAYAHYIRESKKADDLHKTILDIAMEENWLEGIPLESVSFDKLHAYARMKGIITQDERNLLKQFYPT